MVNIILGIFHVTSYVHIINIVLLNHSRKENVNILTVIKTLKLEMQFPFQRS